MNEQKLRQLVKEEVQSALLEHGMRGLSHEDFRKVVSGVLVGGLQGDEGFHETWKSWQDLLKEGGPRPDVALVQEYAECAALIVLQSSC